MYISENMLKCFNEIDDNNIKFLAGNRKKYMKNAHTRKKLSPMYNKVASYEKRLLVSSFISNVLCFLKNKIQIKLNICYY